MHLNRSLFAIVSCAILLLISGSFLLKSQTALLESQTAQRGPRALIREKVDENKTVALAGNTRPEATADNDAGEVSGDFAMEHMMLQMKRSPEQERAVVSFIDDLHDPNSPNFHKWLTAAEFGRTFGSAEPDMQVVTGWLESRGFTVNIVYPNRMLIDFSGNAGQVKSAFHTSIHHLVVNGVQHFANFSDPQIPQALAPAVAGIVSLHDFRPHIKAKPAQYTYIYNRQQNEAVTPADLATIYDFNPLFSAGTTGTGQTIVVVEDTDLYSPADWSTFRRSFGLSKYTSATLVSQHPAAPGGNNNCVAPGVNGADVEAALDVEWASAAAPGANIITAACGDSTFPGSGVVTAMQNLVNSSTPPAIMSVSYGYCEAITGVTYNISVNSLYQQAVAEGTSIFVAAGDEGAAGCDSGAAMATHGISVDGFASTPYNVAAGGTDFADVIGGTVSTYWGGPNSNTSSYGSALSYIPEIPWNGSCASTLLAQYFGYSSGYGAAGYCNSVTAQTNGNLAVAAGGGGPSNCATGVPSVPLVSGGTCAGYAKPSWQTGVPGIPNDGVRDLPDVSMFASNGVYGHISILCFSDQANGGAPCVGAPSAWAASGGTSLAAPVLAGIQALVNQKMGGAQGNPNAVYYKLALTAPSAFHSITQGDIDVDCAAPWNCFGYLGTVDYGRNGRIFGTTWAGALSVSGTSFAPAYAAGTTWNFATGLGSIDVANLVNAWPKSGS